MTDSNPQSPQEEPRNRFRRLSGEEGELEEVHDSKTEDSGAPVQPETPARQPGGDGSPLDEAPEQGDETRPNPPAAHSSASETQPVSPPTKSDEEDTQPVRVGAEPMPKIRRQPTDTAETRPARPANRRPGDTAPVNVRRSGASAPGATRPGSQSGSRPVPSLPNRVNEVDVDATRVTPAAYSPSVRSPLRRPSSGKTPPPASRTPAARKRRSPRRLPDLSINLGCLLRGLLAGLFALVFVALCVVSILFYQYYRIASTLPNIDDLRQKASQFETTRILDRNGNTLYEILDPTAGRRTHVTLDRISPYLVAATVATEDQGFYSHPGFDITAIVRAFWQNYQSGETVSGASTITQQLARALLFSPEERTEQSYQRKVREAVLAAEITRRYTKDEILELYLNEIYYGNLAYGVEAAAETYFGTTADQLTLGQAAFLAGLPQAPSVYDVYNNPEITFDRMQDVLVLMYQTSQEQGCIYVSNSPRPVCIDPVTVVEASDELKAYNFNDPDVQIRYPHWVNFIRSLLESQFDAQTIYRSGFTVYTTLDPGMQDIAQETVAAQVGALADRHVTNGALVAMRPSSGEILAMVGSADFYNEAISGQVNMALAPRQPGSTMKPLTYIAAFEKGWTPATLLWDVPSEFPPSGRPDDPRPPYEPVNYDGRFHGPVRVREALANSYNVPAVKTLDFVGIYDDPNTPAEDGLIPIARRVGITTLNRDDYGLSLTLGGGEVTLLELTNFYATLANVGRRIPPVAITRILDHQGNLVYEYHVPPGDPVIRPEHAYLITSILSDNAARTPAFGANSVLNLPFPAAAKTGTTNDVRDNWTLGYTPDLAVGVWVGNADFTPMQNTSGLTGAAPIWADFMQQGIQQLTGGNPTPFSRPPGIVEYVICEVSGTKPSKWCPEQRTEIFAADQPPLPEDEDLWQRVELDTWTGLKASDACSDFTDEQFVINVEDTWARDWILDTDGGRNWARDMDFDRPITFAPERECRSDDPRPRLEFTNPDDNDTIRDNPLSLFGVADATDWFDFYRLDYGIGEDPVEWNELEKERRPVSSPEEIYEWDLENLMGDEIPAGPVTFRLYMESTRDTYAETEITLNLQVPTPTPTPTMTPTETPTPTESPTPTLTPTVPPTVTPSPTIIPTKVPKATKPPTATETQPAAPTQTPDASQQPASETPALLPATQIIVTVPPP